jgi:hypothetical protein
MEKSGLQTVFSRTIPKTNFEPKVHVLGVALYIQLYSETY